MSFVESNPLHSRCRFPDTGPIRGPKSLAGKKLRESVRRAVSEASWYFCNTISAWLSRLNLAMERLCVGVVRRCGGWGVFSTHPSQTPHVLRRSRGSAAGGAPDATYFPNSTLPPGGSRGTSGEGIDVLENHHSEYENAFALPGLSSDPPGGRVVLLRSAQKSMALGARLQFSGRTGRWRVAADEGKPRCRRRRRLFRSASSGSTIHAHAC